MKKEKEKEKEKHLFELVELVEVRDLIGRFKERNTTLIKERKEMTNTHTQLFTINIRILL